MSYFRLKEHEIINNIFQTDENQSEIYALNDDKVFKISQQSIEAKYYIGLDRYKEYIIFIEPKLNSKRNELWEKILKSDEDEDEAKLTEKINQEIINEQNKNTSEVDLISMLMEICKETETHKHISNLVHIRWDRPQIEIEQKLDFLTPFLVMQYLLLLKEIVKKGLKKSSYRVKENLNAKVKGKILIHQQIKQNLTKGNEHKTVCEFSVFGVDTVENQFLKTVLRICSRYIANNSHYFQINNSEIARIIGFCESAFVLVSDSFKTTSIPLIKQNPFFKEYKETVKIGEMIIKNNSYHPQQSASKKISLHPFWIDMPLLFELYVLAKLKAIPAYKPKGVIEFQFQADKGNILDFLLNDGNNKFVIDAKYKTRYEDGGSIKDDMRQIAGYARLNKVYNTLKITDDRVIPCIIIYPSLNPKDEITDLMNLIELKKYKKMFVKPLYLPCFNNTNS